MSRQAWEKLVFLIGDLHKTPSFPFFNSAPPQHKVCFEEILEVLPAIEYGDVGLHRDLGYLSNVFIPGFMKHAWMHVNSGNIKAEEVQIVEAISEGVVQRSALYPLYSDYSIILQPVGVSESDRKGACLKAKSIVGENYDVDFHFDIEKELSYYRGEHREEGRVSLQSGEEKLQAYDPAFSCTEVCSFSWWHQREKLRLYRQKRRGQDVIIADDFMKRSFKIRWCSESVTVDVARSMGLHEEGLSMLEDYRQGR